MALSILLSIILLILGLIHFNWVFGGTFGFSQSIPTKENGERLFNPKKIESAIVGILLSMFGFFYLLKSGVTAIELPFLLNKYASWLIPILFILRAIGELKYVGFFKRIKNTEFSKWDTKLFSPLCLFMGITGILIHIL